MRTIRDRQVHAGHRVDPRDAPARADDDLPSTPSRTMRLGDPTSSLPSGVTVAALIPRPDARIAAAASSTILLSVSRRFSSERS